MTTVYKILLVDDSATMNAVVKASLMDDGFEVDSASTGEQAWEMLQQNVQSETLYDCVLLDWMLPGMSGADVLESITADNRFTNMAVMIFTERADENAFRLVSQRPNNDIQLKEDIGLLVFRMRKFLDTFSNEEALNLHSFILDKTTTSNTQSNRILFVDDSKTVCAKYQQLLEQNNYEVAVAYNKKQALEIAEKFLPQLAIIDFYMPEGNGDELCVAIKNNELISDITLVMHSQRKEVLEQALDAGAIDLIWKDEPTSIFLLRVSALVESINTNARAKSLGLLQNANATLGIGMMIESDAGSGSDSGAGWQAMDDSMQGFIDLGIDVTQFIPAGADEDQGRLLIGDDGIKHYYNVYSLDSSSVQNIVLVQDVTNFVEADEKRGLAEKQAKQSKLEMQAADKANRLKTEFLSNMSHEMRTPLHSIMSFTKFAMKKATDEKQINFLTRVTDSSDRLMSLLDNLLVLSKLDSGNAILDISENEVGDLLKQVVVSAKKLSLEKNIAIELCLRADVLADFDKDKIIEVIYALIENAVQFSPQESVVSVDYQQDDKGLSITVSDQGVGIPEDELEKVFEKFSQSSLTNDNAGGTGLGLAISKGIMELHQGDIKAKSPLVDGCGTAVTLFVPVGLAA